MEKPNWKRNPAGDRPALRLGLHRDPIPRQLGFINELGSEVQVSVDHAITLGLIEKRPKKVASTSLSSWSRNIFKR